MKIFKAEPCYINEEDLFKFSGSTFFFQAWFNKSLLSNPLVRECNGFNSFSNPQGPDGVHFPFDLVTACPAYIRLVRLVLAGLTNVAFYFDNILIYSSTW